MAMNPLRSRRLWMTYGAAIRFAIVFSGVFGAGAGAFLLKPPLQGALLAMTSAMVDGLVLMALIGACEIFLPRTRFGQGLARRPFLVTVLLKAATYLLFTAAVLGGRLGPRTIRLFTDPETAHQMVVQLDAAFPRGLAIVTGSMIVFLLVMVRNASQLVGERTFREIIYGRYHRPRVEERFFLFVDIVGSTPVAERLGPLAVHRYLGRIFQVASDPIDDQRGDVYQYVGDEIVVTWRLQEGRPGARPLACYFAIEAALAARAPEFEREFGAIPRLRGALHAGEVIAGETGGTRRAIVFHGDVMNATSRIENLTRDLGRPFLVSEEAWKRLQGTERYAAEDLGPQQLRGKETQMRVYAVTP